MTAAPVARTRVLKVLGALLPFLAASCAERNPPATGVESKVGAVLGANTLVPTGDTYVLAALPNQNAGGQTVLVVNEALIQFNQAAVAAAVPVGATVSSARLQVTIDAALTLPLRTVSTIGVFRVTHAWTEAGATFNCSVDSNTRNSRADCSGSTAWNLGSAGPNPWATPATATAPIKTGQTGVLTFDVTTDVQGFLKGTFQNFGWMIHSDTLSGAFAVALGSRESSGKKPQLLLTVGCGAGFADCDHDASNGCEQALNIVSNCRGCGVSCDDGNPCTADSCDAVAGCKHTPVANGVACNDGNACTQTDTCQAGACTGGSPIVCGASDQCHVAGVCDPASGVCSNPAVADGTACNDGSACTRTDACLAGVCAGANLVVCAASDQCHVAGVCDPGGGACSNPAVADGTACNDGSACTRTDVCLAGVCAGGNPVVCAASDQCHVAGVCDPGGGACSNPAIADGTACSDSDACTRTDTCQAGACTGSNPVTCTASDQCHVAGVCAPASGTCSHPTAANGTACNDGNSCTHADACVSGTCVGSNPVTCTASDQCHVAGACDPSTGACSNPVAANATPCNDGNNCTQTDACQAGTCVGSNPVTCVASDQCHGGGICDLSTGACSAPAVMDGTICSSACGQAGACRAGVCIATNSDTSGVCAPTKCQPGFADLDKDPSNGCEYACPVYPPTDETCNATDDDCDGQIDERFPAPGSICYDTSGQNPHPCLGLVDAMVRIGPVGSSWIFQFEASRPDATSTFTGANGSRACAKQGVLPWADVTQAEATNACARILDSAGTPMRLCAGPEWQTACEGPSGPSAMKYSLSPNPATYQAGICNDALIANPGASVLYNATIVPGSVWDTGNVRTQSQFEFCYTDWTSGRISDLSGNVAEWTSTLASTSAGVSYFNVRGGSYNTVPFKCTIPFPECCANGPPTPGCVCDCHAIPGITCEDAGASQASTVASPDVGFRCCADHAP